jgi:tripartite-type tricarboxylate transporter receptor subunit TctC
MNHTGRLARRAFMSLSIGVLSGATLGVASAQDAYPSKSGTWVMPFTAGGPNDALACHIAERVASELGHPS